MRLTDPLHEGSDAPIYDPPEAEEHITSGGYSGVVFPITVGETKTALAESLSVALDEEFEEYRFLVGTWEGALWGVYGAPSYKRLEQTVESEGFSINDAPIFAVYDEDDKRPFPIQHERIYAVANEEKARRSDSGGSEEDGAG